MNKKFSTLVAAFLVAGGMSSSMFAVDKTFKVDTYVTLENGGKSLIVGEDASRDSLALTNSFSSLYDYNKHLWKVSVEAEKNADGLIKGYNVYLENKINGAVALTKADASKDNSAYYAPGAVVASGKFKIANASYNPETKIVTITDGEIKFGVDKVYNASTKTVDGFMLVEKNGVIKLAKGTKDASKVTTEAGLQALTPEYHSDFAGDQDMAFTVSDVYSPMTLSAGFINGIGNESFHLAFNKDITENAKYPNPLSANDLAADYKSVYSSASYAFGDKDNGYVKALNAANDVLKALDAVKKDAASYVKEVKVALGEEASSAGAITAVAPNAGDLNTVSTALVATIFKTGGDVDKAIAKLKEANAYAYEFANDKYIVKESAEKAKAVDENLGALNELLDDLKSDSKAAIDKYNAAINAYAKVAYRIASMGVDYSDYQIDEKDADEVLTAIADSYEGASQTALQTLATTTPVLTVSAKLTAGNDYTASNYLYYPYAVLGQKDTYVTVDTNYVASREKYLALGTTTLNTVVIASAPLTYKEVTYAVGDAISLEKDDDFDYRTMEKILVPSLGKVATPALFKMEVAVKSTAGDAITIYANAPKPTGDATAKYFRNYTESTAANIARYFAPDLKIVIRTLGTAREASVQTAATETDVLKNTVISFTEPLLASKIKDGGIYHVINKNVASEDLYNKYWTLTGSNSWDLAKQAYANVPSTQWLVEKNNDRYTLSNRDYEGDYLTNRKIFVVDEDNMIYTTSARDTFQLVEVDAVKEGHLGYKFISEEIQKISDYVLSAVNYANMETPYYLSFDGNKDSLLTATADAEKALQLIPMIKDEKEVTSAYKMNDENLSKQYYQLISKSGKDTLYLDYTNSGELIVTKVPTDYLLQFRNINDDANQYEVLIGEYDAIAETYNARRKLSYNQVGEAIAVYTGQSSAFVYDLVDKSTDIYKNFGFTGTTNIIISLNGDEASKVTKVGPFAAVKRTGLELRAAAKDEDFALVMDTAFVDQKDNIRYAYYITKPIEAGKTAWNDEKCYMVTYKDSVAADRSNDTIKYSQDGLTRIGFVHAKRINADSLAISKIAPAAADTLNVTEKAGVTNATFAFAIDENDENAYRIESSKGEYVSYLNGVLVLGAKEQAQLFNVTETELIPTDNEAIEAEGVKIIAGNGFVMIQGAAGETAYVRTVLGQTVAETVLTSDNATIAAPAGVVFVTVGNETAKVVVK
ncbi:DUF6383 domain-containing protein [Parabacteroides sp.]|uniref:DUF6383 domain-containing protein n=1 Tax=Parabacteroides sp. TaxID=1869337 RepID=UPI00257D7D63|nr:DUF6383 domain-containing protein [Parabacteroides sp.]